MDNRELFTHKTDDYSRFRPSYPDSAIDWLAEQLPDAAVADIGAGTGIFTKALIRKFKNITAVEPNAAMREKFTAALPQIPCSDGSAEITKLPDSSVDLVTAAQAFHWFDAEKFKQEAARILRSGGKTAIIWNTSLDCDFTMARNLVCRKYCPGFTSGYAGKRSPADGDLFLQKEFFCRVEVVTFRNDFPMDLEIFEGNMRSRSYALMAGDEHYPEFIESLRSVFHRYMKNGIVVEPQETQIYLGSF